MCNGSVYSTGGYNSYGGNGNDNGMQIFHYFSKEISSQISPVHCSGWVSSQYWNGKKSCQHSL